MSPKWKKIQIPVRGEHEAAPVPIVADAAMATGSIADGRLIPLVILDTAHRPDIDQLVKAHENLDPGDVDTQWGRDPNKGKFDTVRLYCDFKRPVPCLLFLDFTLPRMAALVDLIIGARAIYLQPGKPGQRLVTTFDNPRILAEVHVTEFGPEWDRIYRKVMEKEFREHGLRRAQARDAAQDYFALMRQFREVRKGRAARP